MGREGARCCSDFEKDALFAFASTEENIYPGLSESRGNGTDAITFRRLDRPIFMAPARMRVIETDSLHRWWPSSVNIQMKREGGKKNGISVSLGVHLSPTLSVNADADKRRGCKSV